MKTIKCDVCGRELGKEVDIGNFISWGGSCDYRPSDFMDSGIIYQEKRISDICSECFKKIAEGQKKVIEDIRNNQNK
jgi:hypothetical protein